METKMPKIQSPVVAGMFYPADPKVLNGLLKQFFLIAKGKDALPAKAIVAPHAGYEYSGQIAASAYANLAQVSDKIKRVVVLAPSHRYPFFGLALSTADQFLTPLGKIDVDKKMMEKISTLPSVTCIDTPFAKEHSLEVQLPFLQFVLKDFLLVPIIVGEVGVDEVSGILELVWGGDETLIVVSSDLSHYNSYEVAQNLDHETAQKILNFDYNELTGDMACGYVPLRGLLKIAKQKQLRAELIDLRNSGDTEGTHEQVVGYGAFTFR